jgi:hypothetical protein
MNAGLENLSIASLVFSPASPPTLFAGTQGGSVWQYSFVPYPLWLPRLLKGYGLW